MREIPVADSVDHHYEWSAGTGPKIHDQVSGTDKVVTRVVVTVFPGTDEPPSIGVQALRLTASGSVDKRQNYDLPALDQQFESEFLAAWADQQEAAKVTVVETNQEA